MYNHELRGECRQYDLWSREPGNDKAGEEEGVQHTCKRFSERGRLAERLLPLARRRRAPNEMRRGARDEWSDRRRLQGLTHVGGPCSTGKAWQVVRQRKSRGGGLVAVATAPIFSKTSSRAARSTPCCAALATPAVCRQPARSGLSSGPAAWRAAPGGRPQTEWRMRAAAHGQSARAAGRRASRMLLRGWHPAEQGTWGGAREQGAVVGARHGQDRTRRRGKGQVGPSA